MRVAIKYCGSCNPGIDLPRIAQHLQAAAHCAGITLVPLDAENIDALVILNGCPVACADREDIRSKAAHSLVVAGEMLEMVPVAEEALPDAVEAALRARLT